MPEKNVRLDRKNSREADRGPAPVRYEETPISKTADLLGQTLTILSRVRPYLLRKVLLEGNSWYATTWVDGLAPHKTTPLRNLMDRMFGLKADYRFDGRTKGEVIPVAATPAQRRLALALEAVIQAADEVHAECVQEWERERQAQPQG